VAQGFPWNRANSVESPSAAVDHERVTTPASPVHAPAKRRFRLAVVAVSAVAAIVGSALLATRDAGQTSTTQGITATLQVPGHPGSIAAGADVLWVALRGDPRRPVRDQPLLRLDLAGGTVAQRVRLGGEVSSLTRDGERLIVSVTPVGEGELGRRRLVALDWRSGAVISLGGTHLSDTDAREIDVSVDHVVRAGNVLWALETRRGRLLALDHSSLTPSASPVRLSGGRTPGLAAGNRYLWVTAGDAGDVLRVDPATRAIVRVHVGGFPVGIAVTGEDVWVADRSGGSVVRLDARTLRPIGDPIRVGTRPSWLAVAGDSLFVTDEEAGTIARIDARSGRKVGLPIRIGPPAGDGVPPAMTSTGESVWVSSPASNTVTRISSRPSLPTPSSEVTLHGTGNGQVNPVTDGGVAGTGHFTVTGAIDDTGTYIGYRRVRGHTATVRNVFAGEKGTITIVITIDLSKDSLPPWTVVSGTKSYEGLRGKGTLIVDNYLSDPYTFVMKGTVSGTASR
jgi:hypothetical protein